MLTGLTALLTTFTGAGLAAKGARAAKSAKASRGSSSAAKTLPGQVDDIASLGRSPCIVGMKNCFVAGTVIVTGSAGSSLARKLIQDIEVGDQVWSRDDKTGEVGYKSVEKTFVRQTDKLTHLSYGTSSGDATIVGTDEHPFWSLSRGYWVEMGELVVGEKLSLGNGSETTISARKIEYAVGGRATMGTTLDEDGYFTVYNFRVADWHTYHASPSSDQPAVWVHNASSIYDTIAKLTEMRREGGIVYVRRDLNGNIAPYIGQAKSETRFFERQIEHARNNPDAYFEFEVVERGVFPGLELDVAEYKVLQQFTNGTAARKTTSVSNKRDPLGRKRRKDRGLSEPSCRSE